MIDKKKDEKMGKIVKQINNSISNRMIQSDVTSIL